MVFTELLNGYTWEFVRVTMTFSPSSPSTFLIEKALTDGIIDVDEEQAISALQEKMNNITARWKESEAQAKWDWINQEYGNLNAADLESGSFTDLLEAMRGQRQSAKESVQADVEQWYSELNSMESAGRITAAQNKQYKEMTGWYVKGQEGSELTKSLQLGANTLNSAYAEKIQSNRQSLAENAQYSLESAQNMLASGDTFSASNALMYGFNELGNGKTLGFTTDATQNALSTMYESMKPDVTQMQGLIDDYREVGKAVPQSLMDSFNEAIEVGAAAGDTAATWQNWPAVPSAAVSIHNLTSHPSFPLCSEQLSRHNYLLLAGHEFHKIIVSLDSLDNFICLHKLSFQRSVWL